MTQFTVSYALIRVAVDGRPLFTDEVAEWVRNNNNSASPYMIEHIEHTLILRTHYRLTAMFENDIDAILFKMRWL